MIVKSLWLFTFVILIDQNDGLLTKDLKATLPSGDKMPMIGLGTSRIRGAEDIKNALDNALAAGYRLFDSAALYSNEEDIGKALKELLPKHNLTRKDIFITSKLAPKEETFGKNAYSALEKSVKTMDCAYLDLYLIHYPGIPVDEATGPSKNFSQLRDETWQQLVKGVKNGLTRNIGVSNYNVRHLTELVNNDHGIKVAINQVEWHPNYHQEDVLEFCKNNGILLQAYSSLGGTENLDLINNPTVKSVSEKLGESPAKILLRWALQQNIAIIPKSVTRKHMESNIDLNFEIPSEDMALLSNLSQIVKYKWNPDFIV